MVLTRHQSRVVEERARNNAAHPHLATTDKACIRAAYNAYERTYPDGAPDGAHTKRALFKDLGVAPSTGYRAVRTSGRRRSSNSNNSNNAIIEMRNVNETNDETNIGKHNKLTVSILPSGVFRVYKGKNRVPHISRFLLWFMPMVLLGGIAYLPYYFAVIKPNNYYLSHYTETKCVCTDFLFGGDY